MKTTVSTLALSLFMIGTVLASPVNAQGNRNLNDQLQFELFSDSGRVAVAYQNGLAYQPMFYLNRYFKEEALKLGLEKPNLILTRVNGPGEVIAGLKGDPSKNKKAEFDFGTVGANAVPALAASGYKLAAALGDMSIALNVNDPSLKSFADLKDSETMIAVPTRRTSIQSDLMGMAWQKVHGPRTYMNAVGVTVGLDHMRAMAALIKENNNTGSIGTNMVFIGEDDKEFINLVGHFATPPYQYMELKNKNIHTLITSDEILGGASTFQTLVGSEKFVETHPKTYQALIKALERSIEYINTHKKEVAEDYARANPGEKASAADILAQLNDPSIKFTTTPHQIMQYAEYAVTVGNIKKMPRSFKEMSFSNLYDKAGS